MDIYNFDTIKQQIKKIFKKSNKNNHMITLYNLIIFYEVIIQKIREESRIKKHKFKELAKTIFVGNYFTDSIYFKNVQQINDYGDNIFFYKIHSSDYLIKTINDFHSIHAHIIHFKFLNFYLYKKIYKFYTKNKKIIKERLNTSKKKKIINKIKTSIDKFYKKKLFTPSFGEKNVINALNKINITFFYKFSFDFCKNVHTLEFDFFCIVVHDNFISQFIIEFDGDQHFSHNKHYNNFNASHLRDIAKQIYLTSMGIHLLRLQKQDNVYLTIQEFINKIIYNNNTQFYSHIFFNKIIADSTIININYINTLMDKFIQRIKDKYVYIVSQKTKLQKFNKIPNNIYLSQKYNDTSNNFVTLSDEEFDTQQLNHIIYKKEEDINIQKLFAEMYSGNSINKIITKNYYYSAIKKNKKSIKLDPIIL